MRKAPRALGGANLSTTSPPSPARTLALPGGNSSTACSSPASSNSLISANKTTSASNINYTSNIDSNIDSNTASTNSFGIGTACSTAGITSTIFTSEAVPPSDWCVLRLTESWKRSMLWTRRHGLCLMPTPRNASLFRVSQRQCHPWGLMILSVLHAHPLVAIKYRWNHIPSPPKYISISTNPFSPISRNIPSQQPSTTRFTPTLGSRPNIYALSSPPTRLPQPHPIAGSKCISNATFLSPRSPYATDTPRSKISPRCLILYGSHLGGTLTTS
ncbi:hypothetical protein DL98DRAFT_595353 [Cadophora sp. DSE1049]|nr:hypothetical protein DL98DRAFT_595353 [Cadophora sp. DSE1049]